MLNEVEAYPLTKVNTYTVLKLKDDHKIRSLVEYMKIIYTRQ